MSDVIIEIPNGRRTPILEEVPQPYASVGMGQDLEYLIQVEPPLLRVGLLVD